MRVHGETTDFCHSTNAIGSDVAVNYWEFLIVERVSGSCDPSTTTVTAYVYRLSKECEKNPWEFSISFELFSKIQSRF